MQLPWQGRTLMLDFTNMIETTSGMKINRSDVIYEKTIQEKHMLEINCYILIKIM
jgi:hypothetical protein